MGVWLPLVHMVWCCDLFCASVFMSPWFLWMGGGFPFAEV